MMFIRSLSLKGLIVLLISFLVSFPSLAYEEPVSFPGPIKADVIRIIDGDTIDVRAYIWIDQTLETRIRILGIDTPEMSGKCATEIKIAERAKSYLDVLLENKPVILSNIRHGKYGNRVLANVTTSAGKDVTTSLLNSGFARPYHGERRRSWC